MNPRIGALQGEIEPGVEQFSPGKQSAYLITPPHLLDTDDNSHYKLYDQLLQTQRFLHTFAMDDKVINLLNTVVRVTNNVTTVLDLGLLLRRTASVISDEFDPCHAGIFLIDETNQFAVLRAGQSQVGQDTITTGERLALDDDSFISAAIRKRQDQIAPGASQQAPSKEPDPSTARSRVVLPLDAAGDVIGVLIVQSEWPDAFGQADVITLQIIADQLAIAINNSRLYRQIRDLLYQSERRARLLDAANVVGHSISSILDMDKLLPRTVETICEAYGFYYAGVFLIDESGKWAVLSAGRGEAGAAMIAAKHKLAIDGNSMVGTAIRQREARIALDVGEEAVFFKNPHLPRTRSEMALPLVAGDKALGAVTIQSVKERAFGKDDETTLQAMADYLAIAIHNAQAIKELEKANSEIVRTKTFEAIATATGEAIHWVGNKAAPISGSVARVTEDVTQYLALASGLLAAAPPDLHEHKFAQLLAEADHDIVERGIDLPTIQARLERQPLNRLRRTLSVESIFEDLNIIQTGANAILNIKEDLMGPARKRKVELVSMPDLLQGVIASMGIASDVVHTAFTGDLPLVRGDRTQLDRVFINLIKNAMEAMHEVQDKKLFVWTRRSTTEPGMVEVDIIDNGVGISPEQIDKIWVAFYTTKGDRGGTGLGLSACLEIIQQSGGKVRVDSQVGDGTTFTVLLPASEE